MISICIKSKLKLYEFISIEIITTYSGLSLLFNDNVISYARCRSRNL